MEGYTLAGSKGGYKYHAYLPYYPKRFEVSEELDDYRQVVYQFKDGLNSGPMAKFLAAFAKEKLWECTPAYQWWLCIIPASTHDKTEERFEYFCEVFCKQTGFQNGYGLIRNSDDREAKHLVENRNSVDVAAHISFGNVRGKNIILFDDVYTTGKSFLRVASALQERGARKIRGLFLAKTHWKEELEEQGFYFDSSFPTPEEEPKGAADDDLPF